jgi:RNA polymerase sigma-70 factor, ECF subfamily
MVGNEDLNLVDRVQQGDRNAFGELVERYQRSLFNIALRIVGDQDSAAEVTQIAFVKAFERISSYDPNFRFFSWIYRILTNAAIDFVKRDKRMSPITHEMAVEEYSVDETIDAAGRESMLIRALQELPPDYRVVIVLRHMEELSYEEIGHMVGIPSKRVKSRLFTARMMLRDILVRKGYKSNA